MFSFVWRNGKVNHVTGVLGADKHCAKDKQKTAGASPVL
jgi:hypothetical protein